MSASRNRRPLTEREVHREMKRNGGKVRKPLLSQLMITSTGSTMSVGDYVASIEGQVIHWVHQDCGEKDGSCTTDTDSITCVTCKKAVEDYRAKERAITLTHRQAAKDRLDRKQRAKERATWNF